VTDLQLRLRRLGFSTSNDPTGTFGSGTEEAIRQFQDQRGLRSDGICGRHTWSAVVEAGFGLGDRVLYRRSPMLHGDDVAELQRRLSTLGFHPGGVDGIYGDSTVEAVGEFQRNVGIGPDGIFGPRTHAELDRLTPRPGGEDLVSQIRERLDAASKPATLAGKRIAVGEEGGFSVGVGAVCRALAAVGAEPMPLHHPEESEQAREANVARADCYIGLRLEPDHDLVKTMYYKGYRYESETSRRLAEMLRTAILARLTLGDGGSDGMAFPILRETQMPAVIIELGTPKQVAMQVTDIAASVVSSLEQWLRLDWESI
jgi:N-acetylmuramoyl-L-alanine amidase